MGGLVTFMIVAIVLVLGMQAVKQRARVTEAAKVASSLGFAHSTGTRESPELPFEVFRVGRSRTVSHEVFDPHDPAGVRGFVHTAIVGSGKTREIREQTCAMVLTNWHAPHVQIDREGVFGRLARQLGKADITTGDLEFDERWKVRSDDPGFALELLNDRLRTWLRGIEDGWVSIEFELGGDHLLAHLDGCHIDRIPELVDVVRQFKASVAPG